MFDIICSFSIYGDIHEIQQWPGLCILSFGAIQKLRNGQRGEGVEHFVTYRDVYFEVEGGYFMKLLRNGK